jgi:hypothetical protein
MDQIQFSWDNNKIKQILISMEYHLMMQKQYSMTKMPE